MKHLKTFENYEFEGQTLLINAIRSNNINEVKRLIDEGADVNETSTDANKWTPLMIAARFEDINMVKLLVEAGADINATNAFGWTALAWASGFGRKEMIKYLIGIGADTTILNAAGKNFMDVMDKDLKNDIELQNFLKDKNI